MVPSEARSPSSEYPHLRRARLDADASVSSALEWRYWFYDALTPGNLVNQAYAWGVYDFGTDIMKHLNVFDTADLDYRARAYYRIILALISDYDLRHAWQISKELRKLKRFSYRAVAFRPFLLWRLWAGTLGGSLALGGSASWSAIVSATAVQLPALWVVLISFGLIVIPGFVFELILMPPHVMRRNGWLWRWIYVSGNALLFALLVAFVQYLLFEHFRPGDGWVGAQCRPVYHFLTAAVASSLGYVVNLVWREKPIFAPQ